MEVGHEEKFDTCKNQNKTKATILHNKEEHSSSLIRHLINTHQAYENYPDTTMFINSLFI